MSIAESVGVEVLQEFVGGIGSHGLMYGNRDEVPEMIQIAIVKIVEKYIDELLED